MSRRNKLIIKVNQIMIVLDCCSATAYRTWHKIKRDLKKSKKAQITFQEFADGKELNVQDVLDTLDAVQHETLLKKANEKSAVQEGYFKDFFKKG
jgi:uncharacterized protein YfbU (UPF0304 family)